MSKRRKLKWVIYDRDNPQEHYIVKDTSLVVERKLVALMKIEPKSWKKKKYDVFMDTIINK